VKKLAWACKPDSVGTRYSASLLDLPSRTHSSASLPLNSFTASGGEGDADVVNQHPTVSGG